MIDLKEWMEISGYRITEGDEYLWNCFGDRAYQLDAWNGDNVNGWSLCIVFSTKTQEVFQVEAHDYKNSRAYQYTSPDYRELYNAEAKARGCEDMFEDYEITELDVEDDWIEKATAIVAGEAYDTRVSIPLDIPDADLLVYMKLAHESDMTFNAFVEMALRNAIEARGITL